MYVFHYGRSGCGSESEYGGVGKYFSEVFDFQVRRSEVVAPLCDAVCFVYGDETDVCVVNFFKEESGR